VEQAIKIVEQQLADINEMQKWSWQKYLDMRNDISVELSEVELQYQSQKYWTHQIIATEYILDKLKAELNGNKF
jgi:hypothetical protein